MGDGSDESRSVKIPADPLHAIPGGLGMMKGVDSSLVGGFII